MDEEQEMLEIWVVCKICGKSNRDPGDRKYCPRSLVEQVESLGDSLRPSKGLCDKHRQGNVTTGSSSELWH